MNKIMILILLAWGTVLLSCYDDKGNYDYHPINELEISGIENEYIRVKWDTLKIPAPIITYTQAEMTGLKYCWEIDGKKVSQNPSLEYIISNRAERDYKCRLTVSDTVLNVDYYKTFKLKVFTPYSEGLMVLTQYDDRPMVSFLGVIDGVEKNFKIGVYEAENNEKLEGKPLGIEQPDIQFYKGVVCIHTSIGTYTLDPVQFKKLKLYDKTELTKPEDDFEMVFCRFTDEDARIGHAIGKNGRLYPKHARNGKFNMPSLYPCLREANIGEYVKPGETLEYDLAPFCLTCKEHVLAFDNKLQQFVVFRNDMFDVLEDPYQINKVMVGKEKLGLPFLAMAKNKNKGMYTSIFYDPETQMGGIIPDHNNKGRTVSGMVWPYGPNDHYFNEKTKMIISTITNFMYYSNGNKIYKIDVSTFPWASEPLSIDIPDDAEITCMKMSKDQKSFYVGVTRAREGKLTGDIFLIDADSSSILKHYEEIGGVPVDLIEKMRIEYESGQDE